MGLGQGLAFHGLVGVRWKMRLRLRLRLGLRVRLRMMLRVSVRVSVQVRCGCPVPTSREMSPWSRREERTWGEVQGED